MKNKLISDAFIIKNKEKSDTFKIAVYTALFTVTATLAGAFIQSYIPTNNSIKAEERALRREAYSKFEDAANTYNYMTTDLRECLLGRVRQSKYDLSKVEVYGELAVYAMKNCDGNSYVRARSNFQGAINDIYSVGTRDAIRAVVKVSEHLPQSVGDNTTKEGLPPLSTVLFHQNSDFSEDYIKFLDQMCIDTRTDDISICTEDFTPEN